MDTMREEEWRESTFHEGQLMQRFRCPGHNYYKVAVKSHFTCSNPRTFRAVHEVKGVCFTYGIMVNVFFSEQIVDMENDKDVNNCQLQKQSQEISAALDMLSKLTCEIKTFHRTLSEQSQWWLKVCFSLFLFYIKHTIVT